MKELPNVADGVLKKARMAVERKCQKSSVAVDGKEGEGENARVGNTGEGEEDVKVLFTQRNCVFQKSGMRVCARKVSRMGLIPARVWGGQALKIAPPERLKLKRQMAAAAGKKESFSPPLFLDANRSEVEQEFSTMATLFWAEGVRTGQMKGRAPEGVEKADIRRSMIGQVKRFAGVVACKTRDLATKWPQWHTLAF